jgi:hypothetical protein
VRVETSKGSRGCTKTACENARTSKCYGSRGGRQQIFDLLHPKLWMKLRNEWHRARHVYTRTVLSRIPFLWEVTHCLIVALLTFILLMWRIWWAPNNTSKCQMGFNSAFKGLMFRRNVLAPTAVSEWTAVRSGTSGSANHGAPFAYRETWMFKGRGAEGPGARLPRWLHFVQWHLVFVGNWYRTGCLTPLY